MKLTCKQCGAAVRQDGDAIIRDCVHDEAGVTAELSATCYGEGGANGDVGSWLSRFTAGLRNAARSLNPNKL
jgi:hypothetical protein